MDDMFPFVGLIWKISMRVLLKAIIYCSSSENINGSILTVCLRSDEYAGAEAKLCHRFVVYR